LYLGLNVIYTYITFQYVINTAENNFLRSIVLGSMRDDDDDERVSL